MKIHLHIDEQQQEIEVHIHAAEYNMHVEQLMKKMKSTQVVHVIGYVEQDMHILKRQDLYAIYTEGGKIYLQTDEQEYEAKEKLYELEEKLSGYFVRINKSILINVDKISSIQSKIFGNPQVVLSNEAVFPVSRNYFKELKKAIGLGGANK